MKIGGKIFRVDEVNSTNELARQLLKKGEAQSGDVIIAGFQNIGRGQFGSSWESNKNENLLFSIVFLPDNLQVESHFYLSKFITLAISDFLKHYVEDTLIKWPNDIICNGKKICGILIENVLEKHLIKSSIIGVGLNVNQVHFSKRFNATSIGLVTGNDFVLGDVFKELLGHINKAYEGFAEANYDQIDRAYLNRLFRYKKWARYVEGEVPFEGKIIGIGQMGELQIEKSTGEIKSYGFKEVAFDM